MARQETKDRILDVAQQLILQRGYAGFSFRDIANAIGIKSASIHYHYPCKSDLAAALLQRHIDHYRTSLETLDRFVADPLARLAKFCDFLLASLRGPHDLHAACLPILLLADAPTLDPPLQQLLNQFTHQLHTWLTDLLSEGLKSETLTLHSPPADFALTILSTLQGALLLSRAQSSPTPFTTATTALRKEIASN